MLFRAIKHQVDKGPVDAVTGKAKYTLNDNRLLREDVEYKTLVRRPPRSHLYPPPGFVFLDADEVIATVPRFINSFGLLFTLADPECAGPGRGSERDPAAALQGAGL